MRILIAPVKWLVNTFKFWNVEFAEGDVEYLTASDYMVKGRERSKFDPDRMVQTTAGMRCPRCKTKNKKLGHGEKISCTNCGLQMQLYGNSLQCSEKEG